MSDRKGFKDMFEKAKGSQAYWDMKLELKQDEIDRLTASLAEAREQLKKYEGCVEVTIEVDKFHNIAFCMGTPKDAYVGQPVTVWVKRRTE